MLRVYRDHKQVPLTEVDRSVCRHFNVEVDPDRYYLDWNELVANLVGDEDSEVSVDELLDMLRFNPDCPSYLSMLRKHPDKKAAITARFRKWYEDRQKLVKYLAENFVVVVT